MRFFLLSIFLTLVAISNSAVARPGENVSPLIEEKKTDEVQTQAFDFDKQNIDVTQPPATEVRVVKEFYYPYTQSISPRLGTTINIHKIGEGFTKSFDYLLGFNYMFPRSVSPQLEVTADLLSNSEGHIIGAKRWIINERNSFRPFYKLGAGVSVKGSEGLATFAGINNYFGFGGFGLEDYYKKPMSIRLELELKAGVKIMIFSVVFGYSWAW